MRERNKIQEPWKTVDRHITSYDVMIIYNVSAITAYRRIGKIKKHYDLPKHRQNLTLAQFCAYCALDPAKVYAFIGIRPRIKVSSDIFSYHVQPGEYHPNPTELMITTPGKPRRIKKNFQDTGPH